MTSMIVLMTANLFLSVNPLWTHLQTLEEGLALWKTLFISLMDVSKHAHFCFKPITKGVTEYSYELQFSVTLVLSLLITSQDYKQTST